MQKLEELIAALEESTGPDWRLDESIIIALDGHVRRVTKLGLNGRTPGNDRCFWPHTDPQGPGVAVPKFTKDAGSRQRVLKKLRAKLSQEMNNADKL